MHSHYTEVEARSYDAIVKNGWLSEVLLAMAVDPLEAEDVADVIARNDAMKTMMIDGSQRALLSLSDGLGASFLDRAKITASQWASQQSDGRSVMAQLAEWDQKVGVWCACHLPVGMLARLPKDRPQARETIRKTLSWVFGQDTAATVLANAEKEAVSSKWTSVGMLAANSFANRVEDAAFAAYSVAKSNRKSGMTKSAEDAVTSYLLAAYVAYVGRSSAFAESEDLDPFSSASCQIIADACLSFPG